MADILSFPLSNQKADRAFWKGATDEAAALGMSADEWRRERAMADWMNETADTAPSEMNMDEPA